MRSAAANGRTVRNASLSSKKPIIVAGPTGVGKTSFAVELALRIDGEIVGADAYQVYSGLEILTAQPTREQQARVPHHLIGCLSPSEPYDAARFSALAKENIREISARARIPILVGGAGFYLKALTHGLPEMPDPDLNLRAQMLALPLEELQKRLDALDPGARAEIDFHNIRRVQRALEICLLTGRPASELRGPWKEKATPDYRGLLLIREKADLEARIEANVAEMFTRGVVGEVRALESVGRTAAMTLGLREIQAHLRGEISESECRAAIVLATRRYAKRQLTWFRNQFIFSPIEFTDLRTTDAPLSRALELLGVA